MPDRIDVLIIEDRVELRQVLERSFGMSTRFDFRVVTRASPAECALIDPTCGQRFFDVIVADLGFEGPNRTQELQFTPLLCRAFMKATAIIVVYSGNVKHDVVVRAIRYGAVDFISKPDCPPQELPNRIAEILESRRRTETEFDLVMEWLRSERTSLQTNSIYAGRHVALVVESGEVHVVASGRTKLEVLLAYEEVRQKNKSRGWSEEPFVYKVIAPEDP
ncbi:MAG: response regulator [Planctomycetaceae bacterium]